MLTSVEWKDSNSKPVKFMANFLMSGPEMIKKSRRQKGNAGQKYDAPMSLKLYNKFMRVDQAYHIMQKNNCQRTLWDSRASSWFLWQGFLWRRAVPLGAEHRLFVFS